MKLLTKLDPKKSSDIFGISPKLLKLAAVPIHNTLTQIFNYSFKLGQFPENMKTTKIIPIHKGD